MPSRVYSVFELNEAIKARLEGDESLRDIGLRGEISNYKLYPSGHAYFSLKDDKGVISCVMWSGDRMRLSFSPNNGDEVVCYGRVGVYSARGNYQFIAMKMERSGQGEYLLRLRELAKKLQAEGLFDESRKREIPSFPKHIGVIAGANSAGLRDVIHNIDIRYHLAEITVFPSLVQGKLAKDDLLRAFRLAASKDLDVLIVARGGGAAEDLSAFSEEAVVRAAAASRCPVISAVGHEVDISLLDYVADKRVSTPTAAAVAATPNSADLLAYIDDCFARSKEAMESKITAYSEKLDSYLKRPLFLHPEAIYGDKIDKVNDLFRRIKASMDGRINVLEARLSGLSHSLEGVSPLSVLRRGYGLLEDSKGNVITSAAQAKPGEELSTRMRDGIIHSKIDEVEVNDDGKQKL